MIVLECDYDPPHVHEFSDDWSFGGARNQDPRADRRWTQTTYIYLNDHLNVVWTTQAPLCLDQALDEFTKHASLGAVYLQTRRNGVVELEDWTYDPETDTVNPLGA